MSPNPAAALVASIPSPSSGTISIGPLDLRLYGLMIALGVIAAVWLMGVRLAERGYGDADDASAMAMWGVGAGLVGARLYHVATDWSRFSDDLGDIPKIWQGGLGIPGGLVAGILAGVWAGKRRGIPAAVQLTCAAPALPLAQAIGRWGNWFNQELFGSPTDLPWALEIDADHLPAGYAPGTTFHPTFLYESAWNFGLAGLLLLVDRRLKLGPGKLMALYLAGYGAGRFWIEGLRIDPAHDPGGLRWNQWVALAAVVAGVAWLVFDRRRQWPPVPADADADAEAEADATDDDAVADDVPVAVVRSAVDEPVEADRDPAPIDDEPAEARRDTVADDAPVEQLPRD